MDEYTLYTCFTYPLLQQVSNMLASRQLTCLYASTTLCHFLIQIKPPTWYSCIGLQPIRVLKAAEDAGVCTGKMVTVATVGTNVLSCTNSGLPQVVAHSNTSGLHLN